jgi:hypothetical protein
MSEYFEALKFLREEISRFAKMSPPEWKELSLEDHLSTIPHPKGRGSITCGSAALSRLRKAADLAISKEKYSGRIAVDNLFRILKDNVSERFIRQGLPFNQSSADKLFSDSLKSAAKAIRSTTHFIPCLISDDKGPEEFNMGKIRFRRRQTCLDELRPQFEQYQSELLAKDGKDHCLLDDALKYYQSFDWIAELTIDNADPKASREIATNTVEMAINFLHILLGATHSQHLRVRGPSHNVDRCGSFEVSDGKVCDVEIKIFWMHRSLVSRRSDYDSLSEGVG